MDKIYVVYWTQTGNTGEMAQAVAKGIISSGKEAEVLEVTGVRAEELKDCSAIALGCPAMGAEVLEEVDFEPFFEDLEPHLAGKKVALFGSYGWGDGEWMRNWVERTVNAGAEVVNGEGLILQESPDADGLAQCEALGKALVA